MTNEEFQLVVLDELRNLKEGQKRLEEGQRGLEEGQKSLEEGQKSLEEAQKSLEEGQKGLEEGQMRLEKKLDVVFEQTANLTEFKTEVIKKLEGILQDNISIHEIAGEHEIAIRTLQRRPV